MFDALTLHGAAGEILWGYHPAAKVREWRITHKRPGPKSDGRWRLHATLVEQQPYHLRQRPLLFTAPREKGFWCWPLERASIQIGDGHLTATLGPPEQ